MTIGPGEVVLGGRCSCGALYVVDQTGKSVGLVMSQALGLIADERGKKMMELVPDEDYADSVLSYDWRMHRSIGASESYMDGYGRLYVVKTGKAVKHGS